MDEQDELNPKEQAEFDAFDRERVQRFKLTPAKRRRNRKYQQAFRERRKEKLEQVEIATTADDIWKRNLDALSDTERVSLTAGHEAFLDAALPMHGFIKYVAGESAEWVYPDAAYEVAKEFIAIHPVAWLGLSTAEISEINRAGNEKIRDLFENLDPYFRYGVRCRIPEHLWIDFINAAAKWVRDNPTDENLDQTIAAEILAEHERMQPRKAPTRTIIQTPPRTKLQEESLAADKEFARTRADVRAHNARRLSGF